MPAQKGKKHWTKRLPPDEVRRRLSRGKKRRKKALVVINKQKPGGRKEAATNVTLQEVTAYALGKVEAILEGLAVGSGVPAPVLTRRVARLLDSKAGGQLLGFEHYLSSM